MPARYEVFTIWSLDQTGRPIRGWVPFNRWNPYHQFLKHRPRKYRRVTI